jgi:hypothetical protein
MLTDHQEPVPQTVGAQYEYSHNIDQQNLEHLDNVVPVADVKISKAKAKFNQIGPVYIS